MKRPFNGSSLVFVAARPHHAHMRIVALLVLIGAASGASPGWAADGAGIPPRNVVVGTGDPNLDVASVQAAVDRGGQVLLQGHFSFDQPPTKSTPPQGFLPQRATVLVSKEVVISGTRDRQGEMTSIDGGTWPFAVEALGVHVTLQGLRFVRPKGGAIQVNAVSGLVIADCRIEGIEPLSPGDLPGARLGVGIGISTTPGLPTPAEPGQPENVSGILSIVNNYIDAVGGTANDKTLGILIFSVGKPPDKVVDLYVSGNRISNVTERAVNIRQLGGRANIERNVITTGSVVGAAGGAAPDVIHAFGAGSYLIAHNSIQSDWAKGAGIRVHGGFADWPITGAIVVDNDVTMSAPESAVFGANSAGIEIRGFAHGSVVLNNRIRGRARAALAVVTQDTGVPQNNTCGWNDIEGFQPSLADVLVDAGVTNTLVVGRKGTVRDRGVGTVIVNRGTTVAGGESKGAELMPDRGREK